MLERLAQIRPAERRTTLAAFFVLLSFVAGHSVLETARDALFLTHLPAAQLPWVYLIIAALALFLALVFERKAERVRERGLSAWLAAAAVVTAAFWPLARTDHAWVFYALYVWSGGLATLIIARFWLLLSSYFTTTQAKRVYTVIGAGSVLGAILGTGLAGVMTSFLPTHALLPAAALLMAAGTLGPLCLPASEQENATRLSSKPADTELLKNPYARRVGLLVLSATLTLTVVDFVFKASVAASVPAAELGAFFARIYFALDVVSLLVLLFLVRPLLGGLRVSGSLAVLPVMVMAGGVGLAAGGGLIAAMLLKGADGSLRHTLHRTASELLFVPMDRRLRASAKVFIEALGHRGAQALASVFILVGLALDVSAAAWGVVVAALGALWVAAAFGLRTHYVNVFKQTVAQAALQPRFTLPQLEMSNLENVIAALNSSSDDEVRAALQILADEGRVRLIPALILFHPSPAVVVDALELLSRSDRSDYLPIVERLLDSGSPAVRAECLLSMSRRHLDETRLRGFVEDACPVVRATALVCLHAQGLQRESDTASLQTLAREADETTRVALAHAISHRPSVHFEDLLIALAKSDELPVQKAALAAMTRAPTARYLATLLPMLEKRQLRGLARDALLALQDTALSYLVGALHDEDRPVGVRHHLPNTIGRFEPSKAAPALLERLPAEPDGLVRYKILRALSRLRQRDSSVVLDTKMLDDCIHEAVGLAYRLTSWRVSLTLGANADPSRRTRTHDLLGAMLKDKRASAIERVFLMLSLRYPGEGLEAVYRALGSDSASLRSGGRELVEGVLAPPLRGAVLGLIDDVGDLELLSQAGPYFTHEELDYAALLERLLQVPGMSLRSLAVYHIGELRILGLRDQVEHTEMGADFAPMLRHTLDQLEVAR